MTLSFIVVRVGNHLPFIRVLALLWVPIFIRDLLSLPIVEFIISPKIDVTIVSRPGEISLTVRTGGLRAVFILNFSIDNGMVAASAIIWIVKCCIELWSVIANF